MLCELHIENFALIGSVSIEFGEGLNVLTGATGVGKSLVVDALNFLLGSRASSESVRSGEKSAQVSGLFAVPSPPVVQALEEIIGAPIEDGEILIRRELNLAGRSRCQINGRAVTTTMLREAANLLVDIHGQHDHESLIHPQNQLRLLDIFAKLEDLRDAFRKTYRAHHNMRVRLEELQQTAAIRKERLELLRFQIREIEGAQLSPSEEEELRQERSVLRNAEQLAATALQAFEALYESDASIYSQLREICRKIDEAAEIDAALQSLSSILGEASYQIEDTALQLRSYSEQIEHNPAQLEQVEERLEEIRRLKSKYGPTVPEVLAALETMKKEAAELASQNEDLATLQEQLSEAARRLCDIGRELSEKRQKAAARLSKEVQKELKALGMGKGEFVVDVQSSLAETQADINHIAQLAGPDGFDVVEFLLSTNVGEPPLPLRKIASGGEIARAMLAIKHRLAEADRTPVLVFDEIDANIGGRLGDVVGQKLSEIAKSHQVLCVTHLPQIACYADRQLKVDKVTKGKRTYTTVNVVDGQERIDELAEMLRGETKSKTTLREVQDMLAAARRQS